MFRTMFYVGIVFIAVLVALRFIKGRPYPTDRARGVASLHPLDKLIYAVVLACVVVLAGTGIWAALEDEGPMHGWGLIIHCTVAPPFAIGLAALAVSLADRCRVRCDESEEACRFGATQNVLFWLALLAGLVVILSAGLPMMGFGQAMQRWLIEVHAYAGLAFFILIVAHAVQFINNRARTSPPVVARQEAMSA